MTQESDVHVAQIVPKQPADPDLSHAIERSVEKQANEEVESVRLFDNYYRCNWWVRDNAAHAWFSASGRIRRSQFLRATMIADKLVIEDLSKGR